MKTNFISAIIISLVLLSWIVIFNIHFNTIGAIVVSLGITATLVAAFCVDRME